MSLRDRLTAGSFAVTAEISPPRGASTDPITATVALLRDWVDAVNVTDNQGSNVRLASWAGSLAATIIALLGVTAATLYQRAFAPQTDLKAAAVIQFAATAAVLGPLAVAVEGFTVRWSWELLAAIAFLVIFASFLAVSALHILMRHGEATRVASMMYLPPIFAVVLELALFGLLPSALTLVGIAVTCSGVAMTVWTKPWKSPTSSS